MGDAIGGGWLVGRLVDCLCMATACLLYGFAHSAGHYSALRVREGVTRHADGPFVEDRD